MRRLTAIWRLKSQYLFSFASLIAARETAGRELRGRAALGLPARTRRVALSAYPRARSWCARPPPARGRSEGVARARSDGRDGRRARE